MAAKSIDFSAVISSSSAIIGAANGIDIKIIGILGRAPKSFKLLTLNSNIQSLQDLKGKTIATTKGTSLYQLLIAILEKQNLTINDINFLSMRSPEALTSLLSGKIDMALLLGASALAAEEQGARILSTGEGLIDGSFVMATRGDFMKKFPQLVDIFLKANQESLEFISKYPTKANEMNFNKDDIKKLNETQDFLYKNKLIQQKIDLNTIIYKN